MLGGLSIPCRGGVRGLTGLFESRLDSGLFKYVAC